MSVAPSPSQVATETNFRSTFLPSVTYDGQLYAQRPPTCGDALMTILTCGCVPFSVFQADSGKKVVYKNSCAFCCDWSVYHDGNYLGSAAPPGCCDNGCMECFCPCCSCGEMMAAKFSNSAGKTVATLRYTKSIMLWLCGPTALACGVCLVPFLDCLSFISNKNAVVMTEKIFAASMEDKQPIGEIQEVYAIIPIGTMCLRCPVANNVTIFSGRLDAETAKAAVPVISVHPQIHNCLLGGKPFLPTPVGNGCDIGRNVSVTHMSFGEAMKALHHAQVAGAPVAQFFDDERDVGVVSEKIERA